MITPILVTNPTNIRYLAGFVGVETRDAYLLHVGKRKYLFTNALLLESAKQLEPDITVVEVSRENPFSKRLASLISKEKIKKVEFEETDLTVAEYNSLVKELAGVQLVPSGGKLEKLRMIKHIDEIEAIKHAALTTDQCFKYILGRIKPGVTEAELAWEIEGFLRARAGGIAFAPIVAFGTHSSQPHYNGRDNSPLRKGSLILLDFGARAGGYCADMTRVVFLGPPAPEWEKAYQAVYEAQDAVLELLSSGERSGRALDNAAQEALAKRGFPPYPHSLGHALGLDIHEQPRLSIKADTHLSPGMVFTVEPGVYREGQYGIRIEDLVLLKKDGTERLSKSPRRLTIV